ncbi:putative rhamnogalacturonase [Aspergillus alliaceus]|uniref:putative rhamnogalacturonase n=1 Tax=Petromyces alliaceus TaxID=209559 RepID=UPI0012A6C7DE|nr:pectin lyase fold/virulence factor [Aspergillus alliaceus]KAB8230004.1 pectin lyase fold/virulence factor [Aspergillus alliaceus]
MRSLLPLLRCSTLAVGQLISPVGPTTTLTQKTTECNILTYGACVRPNPGSRLVIPEGEYLINWGGNWEIERSLILQGFAGVDVLNLTINGEGDHKFLLDVLVIHGPTRLVRLISLTNASLHDLILIDSPKFHTILDFAVNVEAYHLTIRGANLGSYDGIDGIGTNYYIHDNEVTNLDECVSVESPSHHALIENLVLNVSADISNIYARNISILNGNNIAFIITYPGGSGTVTNITFENFRSKPYTGAVTLRNILFRNISGSVADGAKRPPLYLVANDLTFSTNVTEEAISVWTETGDKVVNKIILEYTVAAKPTGWVEPALPSWAMVSTGYGTGSPISVYTPVPLWRPNGVGYDLYYWRRFCGLVLRWKVYP